VAIAVPDQKDPAWPAVWRPVAWLRTHPAARRDLAWLAADGCLGAVMLLVPVIMVAVGLVAFIGSRVAHQITPPAYPGNTTESILIAGTALAVAGLWSAPWLLRAHGALAGSLQGLAGTAELERRVRHLSQSRTEMIDAGAAEIRRIERDLHDGAQARLVAMGMTLDAAGHLIDEDPKAARALLIEARDNSAKALRELRELVRGIHPPVLADRGLAEAVRALALDTPLRIHLTSHLDRAARPSAPIESAAYFAVTELVANVTKHAQASQAWIDIRHDDHALKISVADDGCGGADQARGSGLRGIERRLAAFDGVLAVSSPPGGPTRASLEIPCALS
jgi:signal transduction histidine kinase